MANLNGKTKAELINILELKETEIFELKEELRKLEKCEKYDHITDEIASVYDKLIKKGFDNASALELTQTMLMSGNIQVDRSYRYGYVNRPYR